jgi:hypothetical protein
MAERTDLVVRAHCHHPAVRPRSSVAGAAAAQARTPLARFHLALAWRWRNAPPRERDVPGDENHEATNQTRVHNSVVVDEGSCLKLEWVRVQTIG